MFFLFWPSRLKDSPVHWGAGPAGGARCGTFEEGGLRRWPGRDVGLMLSNPQVRTLMNADDLYMVNGML